MITADTLASIIDALAWPLVVLVLVCIFKNDIPDLLKRIQEARFPGGGAIFLPYDEAPIYKTPKEPSPEIRAESILKPEQPKDTAIKWSNSGHLFWLGHDLVWTVDVLLRGGLRDHIVHGLRQSLHHLRSLGFVGTPIESRLARLEEDAVSSLEKDWTPQRRKDYTSELASLVRIVGDLAEANQPDFEPSPKE